MLSPQHTCVQSFKSCAGTNMIKPIPILVMLCDLSEWCFLKIVQPPLLSSSPCRLKKALFCTKALATDPFSSTFMNCWLWFYYWFRRGFYPKSLQPEKNLLYRLWNLHQGHHLWSLHEGLGFICPARSMGNIFTVQIWILLYQYCSA